MRPLGFCRPALVRRAIIPVPIRNSFRFYFSKHLGERRSVQMKAQMMDAPGPRITVARILKIQHGVPVHFYPSQTLGLLS